MAEPKVSPYSLNDLKSTTDDALGNYLRGLSFKQDNTKLDVRLALGYVSVIIAGVLFAADYKLGWDATKQWTTIAVAVYAVLNGGFTYWMWAVEKGLVFEGSKDGRKISISSTTKKHIPTYFLTVTQSKTGVPSETRKIEAPFTTWFTADGYFVAQPFQQWLASSIVAVGDADLKNAGRDERDTLAAPSAGFSLKSPSNDSSDTTGADIGKSAKRTKRKV